jgi:hypothetical protein
MKANLKGQGGAIALLLLHGEKLGMAIVGICALMFVYFSLTQERLPSNYAPENLTGKIRQSQQSISNIPWDDIPEKHVAAELKDIADIEVQAEDYTISAINPPVIPPSALRTDPTLLPAEDVSGRGGSGLLAFIDEEIQKQRQLKRQTEAAQEAQDREKERSKPQQEDTNRRRNRGDEPADARQPSRRDAGGGFRPEGVALSGDERVELAHWACVVAKVPIKDQLRLYRDVFENARGSEQAGEFPDYRGFLVRRAEVGTGQPLKWEPVAVYDGKGRRVAPVMADIALQITRDWAASPLEVIDPSYTDLLQVLLYPLPPLVGRDWGSEVTHPDIPLEAEAIDQSGENELADEAAVGKDARGATEGTADETLFGRPATSDSRKPSVKTSTRRNIGRPVPSVRRPGLNAHPADDRVNLRAERGVGSERGASRAVLARGVDYWLLRFFDFSVQPGKRYQYQVQLVLADPNQDARVRKDWLDPVVLKRIEKDGKYRFTEWSKPSATIGIPGAGNVRVAELKVPSDKVFNDEPRLKLLVESFGIDDKTGKAMQVSLEKEFRRGWVANLTEDAEVLVDQNRFIEPVDSFKFRTGITVLDMRGGERLSRDKLRPGSALLMSAAGELSVRSELNDAEAVERYHAIFDKDTSRRSRK